MSEGEVIEKVGVDYIRAITGTSITIDESLALELHTCVDAYSAKMNACTEASIIGNSAICSSALICLVSSILDRVDMEIIEVEDEPYVPINFGRGD